MEPRKLAIRNRATEQSPREEHLDRVLAAERDAEDAVAAEEIEAERRLERARRQARLVAKRTEERVTQVRTLCEARIERELQELRAAEQDRAERVEQLHHDPGRQHAAIERVAAWLSGGEPATGEAT